MRVVFVFLISSLISARGNAPHKRFEYKLSFKGPHLVQTDGTIPFWQHGGDAIASDESIRITPSLRSKRGWIWTKNTVPHSGWEIEVVFRANGRGRIGADGLAIWYTEKEGADGTVFGAKDQWNGMGIFFDSFDNDNQHNNPYVMIMLNDGTKLYDHESDGNLQQLGGCMRDFRNKPYPVKAKVEYYEKMLTLWIHSGLTNNPADYEMCLRAENVVLPQNGYFGVSAATGGLADDHDVQSFITHSLRGDVVQPGQDGKITDEDTKKYEKEYEEYYDKLQKSQEEYKKEHPEKTKDLDEDDWFETQQEKELKMIFEGQSAIQKTMQNLHTKLDEVIGKQERTLSQISMGQGQGQVVQQPPPPGGQAQQVPVLDTIKRHEVDHLVNTQRDIVNTIQNLRNVVIEVQQRVHTIAQGQGGGGAQQAGGGINNQLVMHELKDNLNNVRQDIQHLIQRPTPPVPQCPPPSNTNCLSPIYFFVFMSIQLVVILGYMMYKTSQEAAAKKFY